MSPYRNKIINLEHFNPTFNTQADTRKNKSKSKAKKTKAPRPVKRTQSKQNVCFNKDEESMRAFEDYLLGKKNDVTRKSTNSSFLNRPYDGKSKFPFVTLQTMRPMCKSTQFSKDPMQNNALSQMSKDYEYLREKVIKLQNKLDDSERERDRLENQIEVMKTENVKFSSDIKIMRNEHSEIMHSISKFDRRIDQLERENWYLKSIIEGKFRDNQQLSSINRGLTISDDGENNDERQPKMYR